MKKILLSLVLVALVVGVAGAFDIKAAREPIVTLVTASISGDGLNDLPNAYLIYSKDGAPFYISQRTAIGAAQASSIYVRANESILLPAPPAFLSGGSYYHIMDFKANTDSVFVIPLSE